MQFPMLLKLLGYLKCDRELLLQAIAYLLARRTRSFKKIANICNIKVIEKEVMTDTTKLQGKALLTKAQSLGEDLTLAQKAIACGYKSPKENRALTSQFTLALVRAAEIINVDTEKTPTPTKKGKLGPVRARVSKHGGITIGKGYMARLGLQPGDEYILNVTGKNIRITPVVQNEDLEDLENEDLETDLPEELEDQTSEVVDTSESNGSRVPALSSI